MIGNELWLGLFLLTYIIHFAEELRGGEGYPAYLYRLRGVRISKRRFIVLQAVGFAILVAACGISLTLGFPQLMIAILSGFFICNGLSHAITAIFDGRYGPGLIASVVLWIPLGLVSIYFLIGQMGNLRLAIGIVTGFAVNGVVALGTLRGGRIK